MSFMATTRAARTWEKRKRTVRRPVLPVHQSCLHQIPVCTVDSYPDQKIAGRYRIVSLLGKGGMGEVYRADDLRLGQTVALKFLPKKLARDSNRQDRFQAEVRLTRQISHPNVCRVLRHR